MLITQNMYIHNYRNFYILKPRMSYTETYLIYSFIKFMKTIKSEIVRRSQQQTLKKKINENAGWNLSKPLAT